MINYLAQPAADAGMAVQATRSQGEMARLNAMARSRGFRGYEEMIAFERQKQMQGAAQPPQDGGIVQNVIDGAMSIHPKTVFQNLSNIFAGINDGR